MEHVIAAIKMTHPMLMQSPDVDMLSRFDSMKESGDRLISAMITQKGGKVVGDYEGSTIVELPIGQSAVLKELKKRLLEEAGIRHTAIGLGETAEDALAAMKEASKDFTIKVFRPEMIEQEKPVETPSVAVGVEDEPVQKAEVSPDAQKVIADLVGKISNHKEYVESMRDANPAAYESIVEVMQALAAMVSHVKDTQTRKTHDDERARLEKVVESTHDGKFDEHERAILREILSSMQPKSQIKKAEGDFDDVMGKSILKLHAAIPHLASVRSDNPELFGTYVKMVRLLQALHEDHVAIQKPTEYGGQAATHVRPPAKEDPITHPKPVYAPGSIRNYNPQSARQKTVDGDWQSVAGGDKRSE